MFDILEIPGLSFKSVTDPVKTEQNVYELFLKVQQTVPENLGYVALPLADIINKRGVNYTQYLLDAVEKEYPDFTKVYVCQHILVPYLNFYNNIVFTPHTLRDDSKLCIPHYNCLISPEHFIPAQDRKYLYSFAGCFSTHDLRRQLAMYNSDKTPIIDTGAWHYQKEYEQRTTAKESYIDILCNTKFNLSPPGTGVSTIRLYEILAAGSVPVIFNDIKVPEEVAPYCLRTTVANMEKDMKRALDILPITCEAIHKAYWCSLRNEEMVNYILKHV